jgi:hypothetical protein
MAVSSVYADRSSILALPPGGAGLGGGKDAHLSIIASPGGYDLRGLIGFTFPAGFFTPMRKITKVELRLTSTAAAGGGGNHLGIGSAPKALVRRIISAWSANSAGESWSTSPVVYPGPSVTTTGGVTASLATSASAVYIDITTMGVAWAPNSVVGPTGLPGGGAVMYGVALHETGGTADAGEVWSSQAVTSIKPELRYTYDTNAPPNAPTLIRPVGPAQVASSFEAQGRDPENDTLTAYDLQVSTDPTFATVTHWNLTSATTGLTGSTGALKRTYTGSALVDGTRYYWRCRMRDAGGFGAWSSIGNFVKAATGGPTDDMYDYWAQAILSDMAFGRTLLRIGTLRPTNEQVAALLCAEYGDLFRVRWDETSPVVDELVYLLGQRVSLSPDGWAVDAIVEREREVG